MAQDTGGEEAAGAFYDAAEATYTTLIDAHHTVSSLYNMVNVPTGVWINEEGRIVRPNEVAYSRDVSFLTIAVNGSDYVAGLRDWVQKGEESVYAVSPDGVRGRLAPRSGAEALADANFKLGIHFHQIGEEALANKYWEESQRLHPGSWNYHRQDWAFTPEEAGPNWMRKFEALEGKDYYPPLGLPQPSVEDPN